MAQWYYQKLWKLSKINTYLCQYLCISLPQGDHISDLMIIVSFFPANFVEEGYPRPQSSDRLDFKGIGPPGTKNIVNRNSQHGLAGWLPTRRPRRRSSGRDWLTLFTKQKLSIVERCLTRDCAMRKMNWKVTKCQRGGLDKLYIFLCREDLSL